MRRYRCTCTTRGHRLGKALGTVNNDVMSFTRNIESREEKRREYSIEVS